MGIQAHRADLTTSRIEDGSREPEMKKAANQATLRKDFTDTKNPAYAGSLLMLFYITFPALISGTHNHVVLALQGIYQS
ncbi:TPA: hypothetical protein MEA26_004494 [Klebsiella aerogenes]|nr:hypothetical protein [Klebsiella aerogenes]